MARRGRAGPTRRAQAQLQRHLHQIGEGARRHLAHGPGAMDFDGDLADPHLPGNLLVHQARGRQRHHFALTLAERGVALAQVVAALQRLALGAVHGNCRGHRVEEILVPEGLGQEVHRAGLHRPHRHLDIAMPGDEDHRQAHAALVHLALHLQPVGHLQAYVEHHAAGRVVDFRVQERLRREEGARAHADGAQQVRQGVVHAGVVIDDVDQRIEGGAAVRGLRWQGFHDGLRGMQTAISVARSSGRPAAPNKTHAGEAAFPSPHQSPGSARIRGRKPTSPEVEDVGQTG